MGIPEYAFGFGGSALLFCLGFSFQVAEQCGMERIHFGVLSEALQGLRAQLMTEDCRACLQTILIYRNDLKSGHPAESLSTSYHPLISKDLLH